MLDFLIEVFKENLNAEAFVWNSQSYRYQWLLDRFYFWSKQIEGNQIGIRPGSVVSIEADYSPEAISLFLALIQLGAIVVPLTAQSARKENEFLKLGQIEFRATWDQNHQFSFQKTGLEADHELFERLRKSTHPGLVLFSSGSTGQSKGIVHDFALLLKKYQRRRHCYRTLAFLQFDHIGGVDTLFYSLSNASCIVTVQDRSPESVCREIQDHHVEVLPVSPSFLNLLLASEAYKKFDLSSLKYITYGAEVMSESILKRCVDIFLGVQWLQKYGTTEVGTLRSKSKTPESLWVKLGGEGFDTRVVDGMLQIKAHSAMLGYLNAPSPFTEDGWFKTGDAVEFDGEYFKILGRVSDLINVGGEKVYPAEVEAILQELPEVQDATVFGEKNALLGQIVCARVTLSPGVDSKQFTTQAKAYCKQRLQNYKVPVKFSYVDDQGITERFKKVRKTIS